jgi:hypothetical protein
MPRIPKAQIIIVPVPPLNSRRRNVDRSTIGLAVRASMTRKAAADTAGWSRRFGSYAAAASDQ